MSEILGDKLNIVYEGTLLEITPELLKKTILKQNKEIERLLKDNKLLQDMDKILRNENTNLKLEIERLNKQIEEYQKALDETTSGKIDLENIIKEVIEYIENGSDFKSIYFKETDTEFWKIIMEDNLKNDLLKILKGSDKEC